jgi:hypothetical protein
VRFSGGGESATTGVEVGSTSMIIRLVGVNSGVEREVVDRSASPSELFTVVDDSFLFGFP